MLVISVRAFPWPGHYTGMGYTSRHLPHWQPDGVPLFLTWCVYGAIPRNRFPPPGHQAAGKAFVWMDRFLDSAAHGPTWMKLDEIAKLVADAIRFCAESRHDYDLHSYVVMPNHVHMLVTPQTSPAKFMQSLKGFTAREANKRLNRQGERFWQVESYDHWVRDDEQFRKIVRYVEENAVKAGLAGRAEDYRWSSAFGRHS
jgi:putative transposase